MKILIISSCTGEKAVDHPAALTMEDFRQGPEHIAAREQQLSDVLMPAQDLYTGQQHVRLMRGVRSILGANPTNGSGPSVELHILSAGYGLVPAYRSLAPYEATFNGMKAKELRSWADTLRIPQAIREVLAQPFDLCLLLLGDGYLKACALDDDVRLGGQVLAFCGTQMAKKLPALEGIRAIPLSNNEAKRFSCGLVALKGLLAAKVLQRISSLPVDEHIRLPGDLLSWLDDSSGGPSKAKRRHRPNPRVDRLIELPKDWAQRLSSRKLQYFIPEWDDLVDPDFDFESDTHWGGKGNWDNEVYAHQMYPSPNYDGILISKVVAEKKKSKKRRINDLGVHRYLRVPRSFPIMGDCGAFGYIKDDIPPYTTGEILDYYTRLGFDLGVSIDHLIVKSTQAQQKQRYDLTIQNAEDFLREHKARGLRWTPIGAVQGWSPQTYADAARKYVAMGYDYLGLGGLVRTSTKEVLTILDEVHKVVPPSVRVHLFGLSRIQSMRRFADLGVHSVDSASLLRRAWMGTGQNYLTHEGVFYTAIRIPEAGKSFRAKRMVEEERASAETVMRLERATLRALRGYDRGEATVDEVLGHLGEYDRLITPDRPDNTRLLRRTLEDRPWGSCPCPICRDAGVDVIIFRGNNRNRRRGFHNTWAFYRLLQRALDGEVVAFRNAADVGASTQLELPGLGGSPVAV